jgi:hypothetical protein
MPKLAKQYYLNAKGERKVNCYKVNISKQIIDKTNLEDKEIKITIKDNKIIIERA